MPISTPRAKTKTRKRAPGRTPAGLSCVGLAARQGARMRSARAKVLHELLGLPLVAYPVDLARALGADPIIAVLGHQLDAVQAALVGRFGDEAVQVAEQKQRLGTGHALATALPSLRRARGI